MAVPGRFVCRRLLKPSARCEMDYINTDSISRMACRDMRLEDPTTGEREGQKACDLKKNSALCFVFNLVMINALMLTAIIIIHFNRLSKGKSD